VRLVVAKIVVSLDGAREGALLPHIYNHAVPLFLIRFTRCGFFLMVALCLLCHLSAGQTAVGTGTLMVMPFENQTTAPGLEWISEAFPEVLSQRMESPGLYVISRDDRSYAFDHAGIPLTVRPSRATVYRVAEQMDADYVVLGNYSYDGQSFKANAQLLDMRKLHLYPEIHSSGGLSSLIDLQTALAWELLQQLAPPPAITREQFLNGSKPIRLDAFESYIRGILATDQQQRIRYLRNAVKLNPNYTLAMMQLGKTYYGSHEYESAASWFGRIPKDDPVAGEANFLLGMSEFYRGSFEKAFTAFSYLATRLPLTEVYNNLGVVEARRNRRSSAVEYFSKAVSADPNDADCRFNLAVGLFKNGDSTGAGRQLREELQRSPSDGEAKALLELINRGGTAPAAVNPNATAAGNGLAPANQPRVPMERIKRNYDEASYRQIEMEINKLAEARLVKSNGRTQGTYHVDRGRELLSKKMTTQAESEFRAAISADHNNAVAYAQLAILLEKKGDLAGARTEAQTSVRLQPNVDAWLVLARLDLKQSQLESAASEVDHALALQPADTTAQALKRDITAKQTVAK
jgi:tetratricopeptide (TPR) repeat protein